MPSTGDTIMTMDSVRARVRNGRLVMDEPTDLPEGTEVELAPVLTHDNDQLDADDRDALHRALARGLEDLEQGHVVDGESFLSKPRSRAQ